MNPAKYKNTKWQMKGGGYPDKPEDGLIYFFREDGKN